MKGCRKEREVVAGGKRADKEIKKMGAEVDGSTLGAIYESTSPVGKRRVPPPGSG